MVRSRRLQPLLLLCLAGLGRAAVLRQRPNPTSKEQAPCIHVLATEQPARLARLLSQLNAVDFGPDEKKVNLTVFVAAAGGGPAGVLRLFAGGAGAELKRVASKLPFFHGEKKVVEVPAHSFPAAFAVQTWKPDVYSADTREACAILDEKDEVHPSAWTWLRGALEAYKGSLGSIAALGLPAPGSKSSTMLKTAPAAGFVALRKSWANFRLWYKQYAGELRAQAPWRDVFSQYMQAMSLLSLSGADKASGLAGLLGGHRASFPSLGSLPVARSAAAWNTRGATSQSVMLPNRGMAICTLATRRDANELQLLMKSIELFEPTATVYVAVDSEAARVVNKIKPLSKLRLVVLDTLQKYGEVEKWAMRHDGTWLKFQMEKASVLEKALQDGHASALYVDADTFFMAPLPDMGWEALGLSRQRVSTSFLTAYGRFNGGWIFVREPEVLAAWREKAPNAKNPCCQDQTALDALPAEFRHFFADAGLNVGWYQTDAEHSADGKAHAQEVRCSGDTVTFQGRRVYSFHLHLERRREFAGNISRALRQCRHPLAQDVAQKLAQELAAKRSETQR